MIVPVRAFLSTVLVGVMMTAPITARAQELRAPVILWRGEEPDRQQVLTPIQPPLLLPTSLGEAAPPKMNAAMTDIRLSKGAKTAIIVTAIVVGVLIIVGVVALRGRH